MLIAVLAERLGFMVGTVAALHLCWLTGASVGMGSGAREGNLVGVGGESGDREGKVMLDSIDFILLEPFLDGGRVGLRFANIPFLMVQDLMPLLLYSSKIVALKCTLLILEETVSTPPPPPLQPPAPALGVGAVDGPIRCPVLKDCMYASKGFET